VSKKLKVLISVLMVALLLAVGATTTVMAQEGEEEETVPVTETGEKGLWERVAEILGVEKEDLVDAFKQARQEMWEDTFISRLDEAVKKGYITQEQADEIIEWWEQRPEALSPGMFQHTLRFYASPRFHMQSGVGGRFCPKSEQTD